MPTDHLGSEQHSRVPRGQATLDNLRDSIDELRDMLKAHMDGITINNVHVPGTSTKIERLEAEVAAIKKDLQEKFGHIRALVAWVGLVVGGIATGIAVKLFNTH